MKKIFITGGAGFIGSHIAEFFFNKYKKDVTDSDLRKQWDRARLLSGLEHVRFHDLRHTFASWLAADSSIPLTVIRDILGHSSLAVTSRYSHLRTDALDAVQQSLNRQTK